MFSSKHQTTATFSSDSQTLNIDGLAIQTRFSASFETLVQNRSWGCPSHPHIIAPAKWMGRRCSQSALCSDCAQLVDSSFGTNTSWHSLEPSPGCSKLFRNQPVLPKPCLQSLGHSREFSLRTAVLHPSSPPCKPTHVQAKSYSQGAVPVNPEPMRGRLETSSITHRIFSNSV